jgi:hypothetical protein
MFNPRRYILPTLPLIFSEKEKLGMSMEEIGNLKMDLNICILVISKYNICNLNICYLVILRYTVSDLNILHIHISYFRGHDNTRSHALKGHSLNTLARSITLSTARLHHHLILDVNWMPTGSMLG